ncbi:MAG: hypothetical protein GY766_06000 [Herbaspirillum sp.]|uniref:type ISP restriction/modification enzyme n=1 Tax=Herbaspirillum sp. TaxID=1890675 RepID=UPI00258693C4|nr:type ISP restriction/modification enzyme [Herbaspirillum sp.]MCP3654432.1 hypothetical protein [Herbaspirillum sp.]
MKRMIDAFNEDRMRYAELCNGKNKVSCQKLEDVIASDQKQISWTHDLKADLWRNKPLEYWTTSVVQSVYRPFCKQ